jgi:type II secretory pathway pseudopilin PulG
VANANPNNAMKNLKAFTLLEVSLGMVLMSFVIGFAYSALSIIQQNAHNHGTVQMQLLELNRFYALFKRDFDDSKEARLSTQTVDILKPDGRTIRYVFDELEPLRIDGAAADTFRFETEEMACLFNREPQFLNGQLIDEFRLTAYVEEEPYYYHFHKSYAADLLLQIQAKR